LPQELIYIEEKIINLIQNSIKRGKVEFNLWLEEIPDKDAIIEVNYPLLESYIKIIKKLSRDYQIESNINISDILKLNGILKIAQKTRRIEYTGALEKGIMKALNSVNKMREREGKILYKNFIALLNEINTNLKKIKKHIPAIMKKYTNRIRKKISELIDTKKYDENRILMEVALFADKIDINEEAERMESHIAQMKDYLKSSEPAGRQMEFLLQEMLRETNTIGAKVSDIRVTKNVIKIKECIEKLREQVRNIE